MSKLTLTAQKTLSLVQGSRHPAALLLATAIFTLSSPASARECGVSATANYDKGIAALNSGDTAMAITKLRNATLYCDAPGYWVALGDAIKADALDADAMGADGAYNVDAVAEALEAYGTAFSNARSAQDDSAGASAAPTAHDTSP